MSLVVKPKFANLQQLPNLKNNILNAYCKFTYQKQHQTSKVKFNSSKNPDWDTVLTFKDVSQHGVIWVEIYHQQPPYDVLIATTSISIQLLKLKPFVAKPQTIDLLSTKQTKVGTITIMFEYTPSDIDLEMGRGDLYQSEKSTNQDQTFKLNNGSNSKQQNEKPIKKYPNAVKFTESNMLWEQINKNNQNRLEEVPAQKQFIIPPINKNSNEDFCNLPSFGPVQSNGYTFAHQTQSQNFLPQPSYQGSIPGYQMNQFMHFVPYNMVNPNQYHAQNYQISQQSFPPLNYKKDKMIPDPNLQDLYSFSNVTPDHMNYDPSYNVNYYQQQQLYQKNVNKNSHKNLPQQYHNPKFHYNTNPNPTANHNNFPNKNYGNKPSQSPQVISKPHSSQKPQPQRTQRDNKIKQSPKRQTPSAASASLLQKMSEEQFEAYMYKKMQEQLKKQKQAKFHEEMVRKLYQRK